MDKCAICEEKKSSLYKCPRCSIFYCSIACYRSPNHTECSEEFYKNCVREELQNRRITDEFPQSSSSTTKKKPPPMTFEQSMLNQSDDLESDDTVGREEDAEEIFDSDDDNGDDVEDGDDSYLDQVTKATANEWLTMDESEMDRRLTAMGITSSGEEAVEELLKTLTEKERREFGKLAGQLEDEEQQMGRSVFGKKKE